MPPGITGFYPSERDGDQTFVWTHPQAIVALPGLDRRAAWRCWAVLRGARPDPATLPEVRFAVDGADLARKPTTNEYQTYEVTIPAAPDRRGLRLSLTATVTGALVGQWEIDFTDFRSSAGALLFPAVPTIVVPVDDAVAQVVLGDGSDPLHPFFSNMHAAYMRTRWVFVSGTGQTYLYGTFRP